MKCGWRRDPRRDLSRHPVCSHDLAASTGKHADEVDERPDEADQHEQLVERQQRILDVTVDQLGQPERSPGYDPDDQWGEHSPERDRRALPEDGEQQDAHQMDRQSGPHDHEDRVK